MAGYSPLKIIGNSTGLVQEREEFLIPDDAYPTLQNAYVWRERILRKRGYQLLGRLERSVSGVLGNTDGSGNFLGNINALLGLEATATLVPGGFTAVVGANTYTEPSPPDGSLLVNAVPAPPGSFINWATGQLGLVTGLAATAVNVTQRYYPGLPVMGIRQREQQGLNDATVFFDQRYAYIYNSVTNRFQEFIAGTTWNARAAPVTATDFFWSTNYWVSSLTIPGTATPFFGTANQKIFWATNNTGAFGVNADPIRITDGATWVNFQPPNFGQINATDFLVQCLSFLPFRGRMVAFNTWEGTSFANALNYPNRIRWAAIGNPFTAFSAGPPARGAWRDDIRGQGGYLDIPINEDIISVGYVRDNLVIYCETTTWQLRYTGRSIAPFQIERVNSELGAKGPFASIQFDTSLVTIGDKGILECDSYKSNRIDIKIPDYVFKFQSNNDGPFRIHGVRDFINRLAFWTIPYAPDNSIFPTQRLVYNYENDSWAIFTDSLTTLGTFLPQESRNWLNTPLPWVQCNFPWIGNQITSVPSIVGGNQQGFVEYLDELTVNDESLYISAITPNTTTPTLITSPNHNMRTGFVILITGIPAGTPYSTLNDQVFGIAVPDANTFLLYKYNAVTDAFDLAQLDVPSGDYVGGGLIKIRENFKIQSKKFNFLDEGQSIQLGYIDILMSATGTSSPGAMSLQVFLDYNNSQASNILPQNQINDYSVVSNPDTFFNAVIPTSQPTLNTIAGSKFWQRVMCPTRANFLTIVYTFSNSQMAGSEQEKDIQIDGQVLWIRKAGRMTSI